MNDTNVCLLYVTVATAVEAARIASKVVEERLAACANILHQIRSIYWWQDSVQESGESLLVLKTTTFCQHELIARVKQLHGAECPCIVSLPVIDGNPDFLRWIYEETAGH